LSPKGKSSGGPIFSSPPREYGRKDAILLAAERLFSQASYEAVSIRDIAVAAKVNSALIRYHFGTKEELYRTLFEERYHLITQSRKAAIEAIDIIPGEEAAVEQIVVAWVRPLLELAANRGSKNFVALLAREASDAAKDRRGIIAKYLDPSANICIDAFRRALPHANEGDIVQSYLWMIAGAMSTITAAGRARRLASRSDDPTSSTPLLDQLVTFVTSGILAITARGRNVPAERKPASRAGHKAGGKLPL
jgi:AcrR family transcriptional regulator